MMTTTKHKCGMVGIIGIPVNWEDLYPKQQNKIILPLGNDIFLTAKNSDIIKTILKQLEA